MNNHFSNERYARQLSLQDFGQAGQQQLLKAKILVIGAGGLGCPILQYLAAAGVGTLGIMDDDTVSLSNLHRQILYTTSDIGFSKAEKAAGYLRKLNPEINIIPINERLTTKNAWDIIAGYDTIMDGTDNFSTRYLINDACVLLNRPLIYGAVSKWEGQLTIFKDGVNYRDLFPVPPKENEVPNCANAGVLGVLPGIIGLMMAAEAIKLITGTGKPFINRLLLYQMLNSQFHEMELLPAADSLSSIPANRAAFEKMDYAAVCASPLQDIEIDHYAFDKMLEKDAIEVIDVREPGELPLITEFRSRNIPLNKLAANAGTIQSGTVVMICASGVRSLGAAKQLVAAAGNSKKVYSLKGGILEWKEAHSKKITMTEKKVKNIFIQGPVGPAFIADSIQKHQTKTGIGAHSIFLGQVRADVMEGNKVAAIEYTCYEPMALEQMDVIRKDMFAKYELTCMHVYHSLGRVPAGEISLFVFTSSPHRRAAIDACNEIVERIKKELPVWGKETMEDESYQWKKNK